MKTLLLTSALTLGLTASAGAWEQAQQQGQLQHQNQSQTQHQTALGGTGIGIGGAGGTGIGGAGGTGGAGGAGGQSRSQSQSSLTIASGGIDSGNSGGSASVSAAPGFGLPSFGGGQCGIVGFGVAISPSGGGAFGPAWESTNCRNYYIAVTLIQMGKTSEGLELLADITPEARKVLASHPAQPVAASYQTTRPSDCDKVQRDTGRGRMSDEDMAIYRRCHS